MNKKYLSFLLLVGLTVIIGSARRASAEEVGAVNRDGENIRHAIDGRRPMGAFRQNGVFGVVTGVSGSTITINAEMRPNSTTATQVYTIDATNAKFVKSGADATIASIAVGDRIMAQGTVNGQNVAATIIRDGMQARGPRGDWESATSSRPARFGGSGDDARHSVAQNLPIGNGQPVVGGIVTTVNGNILTLTNRGSIVYTIDATNASIQKNGATTTVASIVVNDNIIVQGNVSGNTLTASLIVDRGAPVVGTAAPVVGQSGTPAPKMGIWGHLKNFFSHLF